MQYISDFIKKHKSAVAVFVMLLMLGIIGLEIYSLLHEGSNAGDRRGGNSVTETYDPISRRTYQDVDQEPEEENSSPVYMGFGLLLESTGEDAYFRFVKKTDEWINKKYPDIKYVSLLEESLEETDDGYKFTIYFDSKNPTEVLMDFSGADVKFMQTSGL